VHYGTLCNTWSVFFFFFWRNTPLPQWASAPSFTNFLDHTQRRTTIGRTPLDEWSARRRDLFLTTHNTNNRHTCPRWDSNPQSQQASGRRPTPWTAWPLGLAECLYCQKIKRGLREPISNTRNSILSCKDNSLTVTEHRASTLRSTGHRKTCHSCWPDKSQHCAVLCLQAHSGQAQQSTALASNML